MSTDPSLTAGLTLLGRAVHGQSETALETFPAPVDVSLVSFSSEELTARCPVTGQPDFYAVELSYRPQESCVESKSLKLYLERFREERVFCESLAARLLADLVDATACGPATVVLRQRVRGGLQLTARADHEGGTA